ncbi:MAG: hypothetical protein HKP12_11900 [Gammaproteobacteria bacterium]|nr:hypothetical protein [Gammaproteobacteria bacterium]
MNKIKQLLTVGTVVFGLGMSASPLHADEDIGENCVPVSVKMAIGPDGTCTVRDFAVGDVEFQKEFYPWTNIEGSLFNCEAIGETMTIVQPVLWPEGIVMPTSLAGQIVEGTLGDDEVVGSIACAGHQNTFKQAFLSPKLNLPFIRTQNVSVASLDIPRGRHDVATVHVAFTGAGILHIEDPATFHIGASTAGSVVGLVIETKNKTFVRNKADGHLQVQGHIFEPDDEDPGMLTGHICDSKLAKLVGWEVEDDEDDDEDD